MKIKFFAIGKEHEPYIKSGVQDFTQRIAHYYSVEWKILSPPKYAAALSEPQLKLKEAGLIFSNIRSEDFLIALDEHGRMTDSLQFASFIQDKANNSVKQLVFLIGGAYGLDEAIMKRANFTWSLSPLTFPHQLVRLILAEQVYRACTIIRNEKYHHS